MKPESLATAADQGEKLEAFRKQTKRERLQATIEIDVPWEAPRAFIDPHYPNARNVHRPVGLTRKFRIYFVQWGIKLADEACNKARLETRPHRGAIQPSILGSNVRPKSPRHGTCWRGPTSACAEAV